MLDNSKDEQKYSTQDYIYVSVEVGIPKFKVVKFSFTRSKEYVELKFKPGQAKGFVRGNVAIFARMLGNGVLRVAVYNLDTGELTVFEV